METLTPITLINRRFTLTFLLHIFSNYFQEENTH